MMLADGFEDAFIGMSYRFGIDVPVATYDREKCIEIIIRDGWQTVVTREEADEYFEYNVIGAWLGDSTPIFVDTMSLDAARGIVLSL